MIFFSKNLVALRSSLKSIQVNLAELNEVLALEKDKIKQGDLNGFQSVVVRKEGVTNGLIDNVNRFIEASRLICSKLQHEYCQLPGSLKSPKFKEYFGLAADRLVSVSQVIEFIALSKVVLLSNKGQITADSLKHEVIKLDSTLLDLNETLASMKGYEGRVKENREIVSTFLEFQNKSIRFWQGIQQQVESSYGQDGKAAHARAKPIFSASA